ncbi:galactose-binding lectin l-1-like isoform X12 [Anguilla rostrata]|uniref:galactose-binding lectin l-1-like isoform X11 n=1 Tax=Anguilla rostrata TaxID=7938 RepID=UPI0030D0A452
MSDVELKIAPFKPGMELKVTGIPKPNGARFSINVGHSRENIALHFNPRFDYLGEHGVIVLDSRKDGRWQNPVIEKDFPFQ